MIARTLVAVVALAALVACKSTALTVDASENVYTLRRASLESIVEESLKNDSWNVVRGPVFYAQKLGTGMDRIVLFLTFKDQRDKSSFSLTAKSGHALNFFTIGILGRAGCGEAAQAAQQWLDAFRAAHKDEQVRSGQ